MELCVVSSYAPKLAARGRNDSTVRSAAARRGGGAGGGGGGGGRGRRAQYARALRVSITSRVLTPLAYGASDV